MLQDACNALRLDLRAKENDWWPFGEALYEFRALALHWADAVANATGLGEAGRLVSKIDLSNARHPMGPSIGVGVAPPPSRDHRA